MVNMGNRLTRRHLLGAVGSAAVVGTDGVRSAVDGTDNPEPREEGWCLEHLTDTVPDDYETAEGIDGEERDPDELLGKEESAYQCHPRGRQLCANCTFFIPSSTIGFAGACTEIEGEVRSVDWCAVYQPVERLEEVPETYDRVAGSEVTESDGQSP